MTERARDRPKKYGANAPQLRAIPRVAQRDYYLAYVGSTSGVVDTAGLVEMMGKCCVARDETHATNTVCSHFVEKCISLRNPWEEPFYPY